MVPAERTRLGGRVGVAASAADECLCPGPRGDRRALAQVGQVTAFPCSLEGFCSVLLEADGAESWRALARGCSSECRSQEGVSLCSPRLPIVFASKVTLFPIFQSFVQVTDVTQHRFFRNTFLVEFT